MATAQNLSSDAAIVSLRNAFRGDHDPKPIITNSQINEAMAHILDLSPEEQIAAACTAAKTNDPVTLEALYHIGCDLRQRGPEGETPLFLAQRQGNWEMADLISGLLRDKPARKPLPKQTKEVKFSDPKKEKSLLDKIKSSIHRLNGSTPNSSQLLFSHISTDFLTLADEVMIHNKWRVTKALRDCQVLLGKNQKAMNELLFDMAYRAVQSGNADMIDIIQSNFNISMIRKPDRLTPSILELATKRGRTDIVALISPARPAPEQSAPI